MKIALLVSGLPPERVGGAERQACQAAAHLAARHDVCVFTRTTDVPLELASRPRCVVTRRCRITVPGLRFGADVVQTLMHLGRARKSIGVILAYQTVIDGLIAVLAKRLFGIPVIVSIRCDTEYLMEDFQSRMFSAFVYEHADFLAVQSPAIGEELTAVFARRDGKPTADELRRKVFVMPNGIAPVTPRHAPGSGVVFIGRLTTQKGVDVLIDAMRQCPGEHLTIVGDGPERAALERSASELTNVTFTGMLPHAQAQQRLAQALVLVLPSRHEGQPNVLMEAMSLGVPVIASRVGGVADLVSDGETGLLTAPGDTDAIAHGIRKISTDEAFRTMLSENALRAIRRYAWPDVAQALEEKLKGVEAARVTGRAGENYRRVSGSP
ncbi:MAG TPA: glycosyltransferase [Vicinamibacterales bacterium]